VLENNLYNLDPEHQRDVVHDKEWMSGIVQSAIITKNIPAVYFHKVHKDDGLYTYESLDGKQRCSAVVLYINDCYRYTNRIPEEMYNRKYSELSPVLKQTVNSSILDMLLYQGTMTEQQIENFFQCRQNSKSTTLGEHLNSCMSSVMREKMTHVLSTNQNMKAALRSIKKDTKRYQHLEILARMFYLDRHIDEGDPENTNIIDWWKVEDCTEIKLTEFTEAVIEVCRVLAKHRVSYASSRGIYLSFLKYMIKHNNLDRVDENLTSNVLSMPVTTGLHNYTHPKYLYLLQFAQNNN
jgi:hypothetical protein